jgi:hypothetical protein
MFTTWVGHRFQRHPCDEATARAADEAAELAADDAAADAAAREAAAEAARKAAANAAARKAAEEAAAAAARAKAAIDSENAEFSKMKPVTLRYELGIKIKQLENYKKFKDPKFNQTKLNRYKNKLASLNTQKGGRKNKRSSRKTQRVRTQRK